MQFKKIFFSITLCLISGVSRADQERPEMRQVRHLLATQLKFREGGGSINIGRQCTAHYIFSEADDSPISISLFRNSDPTRIYHYYFDVYELRQVNETSFSFVTQVGEDCETQGCNYYYDFETSLTPNTLQVVGYINDRYDILSCSLH